MGRRVVPPVRGWAQMNCVHSSPIYMCVYVGGERGGDIRCHQIDLLFLCQNSLLYKECHQTDLLFCARFSKIPTDFPTDSGKLNRIW